MNEMFLLKVVISFMGFLNYIYGLGGITKPPPPSPRLTFIEEATKATVTTTIITGKRTVFTIENFLFSAFEIEFIEISFSFSL